MRDYKDDIKEYQNECDKIFQFAESSEEYSPEVVSLVKSNFDLENEYKKYYNHLCVEKISDELINEYYKSIIDMADALTNGLIYECGIEINGSIIHYGHGSEYYNNNHNIFAELLALYSSVINFNDKDEAMVYLKNIFGEELIEILDNYYNQLVQAVNLFINKQKQQKIK